MRMSFVRLAAVGAAATMLLAACGSSGSKSAKSSSPGTTAAAPAADGYGAASPSTMGANTAATAGATVSVADNAKIGKKILVDSNGMTLYVWDNDTTAGKAMCTGQCAANWPPLDVSGPATYGTALNGAMFSTVTGPNGEKQLAVNGKPLYLWVNDKKAGDATGQGVNHFYVVGVDGKKIDSD